RPDAGATASFLIASTSFADHASSHLAATAATASAGGTRLRGGLVELDPRPTDSTASAMAITTMTPTITAVVRVRMDCSVKRSQAVTVAMAARNARTSAGSFVRFIGGRLLTSVHR